MKTLSGLRYQPAGPSTRHSLHLRMKIWSSTPSRRYSGPPSGWLKLSSALLMGLAGAASGAVTLNEVDSSTVQFQANTEGFQFVELKGTPGESLLSLIHI